MFDPHTLIEKKIDGTLTPLEEQSFERLLAVDPRFAQMYANQRSVVLVFNKHQKDILQQQLEQGYEACHKKRTKRRVAGGAIALLFLLFAVGWVGWPVSGKQLFATYYEPYEVVVFRGVSPISSATHPASLYYSQQDYQKALPLLGEMQRTQGNRDYWTLLRGNAYLQVDSTTQARQQFEEIGAQKNSVYQQYAQWYIAVSYLKDGSIEEAQVALQPIAQQPGLFQQKAQQLLEQL